VTGGWPAEGAWPDQYPKPRGLRNGDPDLPEHATTDQLRAHITADHAAMDRAISLHGEMRDLIEAASVKVDALQESNRAWRDHALTDCEALRRCWVLMERWTGLADEAAAELRAAITGEGWWE
jgi:hypothetical protein